MKPKEILFRTATMAGLVIFVLVIFSLRLMQLQVVEGESLTAQIEEGWTDTQVIKAARGQIFDRNGRPLAANAVGRDVVINMAYMERGSTNEVILRLIAIMEEANEEWIDNLPITRKAPFEFKDGDVYKDEIARLKKAVGAQPYATAEDVCYQLREKYGLQELSEQEFRNVAGVRYEMEQRGFNMRTPYVFVKDIKIETVPKIKERSYQIPGVDVVESPIRQYVGGDIAPHIIGQIGPLYKEAWDVAEKETTGDGNVVAHIGEHTYTMNDTIGISGAEKTFENYLRGQDGLRTIVRNGRGDVIDVVEEQAPVPGNSLVLTLDSRLQKVGQDALERKIKMMQNDLVTYPEGEGHEADSGAVVAVEVKTGELLVAATYPSYNLGTYQKDYTALATDERRPLFNRALSAAYTPGSIFKPTVALGALNEKVISSASTVFCGGVFTMFPDYQPRCLSTHGDIDVATALMHSCNIFFYQTGFDLGIAKLDEYARRLGLGEPTGIELEENIGRMSSPELKAKIHDKPGDDPVWRPADVLQASIGQLDSQFSPLQLANYAATLANDGKRMDMTVLKSVKSYNFDKTVYEHEPEIAEEIDAPYAFSVIRDGMVAASSYRGTSGATFGNYPVPVASKTGTPETHQYPNSTYIAYAPADDPQIAVCVVIEKGWHGYTGAPVAKEIFDAYFFSGSSKNAEAHDYGTLLS